MYSLFKLKLSLHFLSLYLISACLLAIPVVHVLFLEFILVLLVQQYHSVYQG